MCVCVCVCVCVCRRCPGARRARVWRSRAYATAPCWSGGWRDRACSEQVQVADAHISASHCVIEVDACDASGGPPKAWAHDMSTNGVFVNGVKIGKGNKACVLSGDLLSFVVAPSKKDDGSYDVEDKHLVSSLPTRLPALFLPRPSALCPPSAPSSHAPRSSKLTQRDGVGRNGQPTSFPCTIQTPHQ